MTGSGFAIWFTDPAYGIGGFYEGIKAEPEQEKHNVYRVDPKSGEIKVIVDAVDWSFLEERFGEVYTDDPGRPPLPTRLMAGLAKLRLRSPCLALTSSETPSAAFELRSLF
jgi:hypothetical protein